MLMALTLILNKEDQQLDIQVNPCQKIADTLRILKENNRLTDEYDSDAVLIKSQRRKEYINKRLSYEQADLYSGDCLKLV